MSIGYFFAPSMAYGRVHVTGTTKNNAILQSSGLTPLLEDPCLYSGFIQDPLDLYSTKSKCPLSYGLYVNDFVYFSKGPAVEALFCRLQAEQCKVDFMGIVSWFLGVHFSWRITPSAITLHLNQSGFASNLVERFHLSDRNQTPTATPYCSGISIDVVSLLLKTMSLWPLNTKRMPIKA